MTGLILLSMFAFVVLPAMTSYLQKAGPGVSDPVLASFNGVDLKRSRIETFTRMHNQTVRFLEALAEKTMELGGSPQVPGFMFDPRSQQIRSLGINQQPSELASIRTLQFAAQAEKQGFELDDTAIENWLMAFTSEKMTRQQIMGMLAKETQNGMGEFHLYDMLRNQLLARVYENGASAALSYGQMPIMTPAEEWQNFLKLNQQASGDAYGILVSEYVDKTDANPPESRIVEVYEAGKDFYSSTQSPEPGFRTRDKATIEYLVGNLQKFVDAEVAKLPEEEIRAEYDRQVARGAFRVRKEEPETSQPSTDSMPADAAPETPAPASNAPASNAPASNAPAEMKEESATTETPAPEPATPAPETPAPAQPKQEKTVEQDSPEDIAKHKQQVEDLQKILDDAGDLEMPAEEMPAEEKPAPEKPASEPKPETPEKLDAPETKPESKPETPAETEPTSEPATEPEPTTEPEPASEPEPADQPKPEGGEQSSLQLDDAVQLVMFQDDVTPASETPAADEPAAENPATENPATETPAADDAAAESPAAEEAKPEIQPYEEVRLNVAEALVQDDARVALDRALTKAKKVMRVYFAMQSRYVMSEDESIKPERPDLKKLAGELGLEYAPIGPHDAVSIADEPISDSYEAGTSFNQRGYPYAVMVFGAGNQIPKLELFKALSTVDIPRGLSYLSWKVEETESKVPTLDEVRDEVVQAVRMEDARELARKDAEALAKQINEGKSLVDVVPEDKKDNLKQNVAPFSWMNSFGFGQATLGNVPELDSVGEEFMSAVFNAEGDEAVVAGNLPQNVVYVFRRTELQPAIQDLRSIFKQPTERMKALSLGMEDRYELRQGFVEMVDEKTGLVMGNEAE
ncbi:hypothetical protein [Stieleria varia]|uniref:Periplasmic folding chaperone n=2 Tax=Stieleria varia TaxID=2528005 RepID=A0A5C6AQU6_9BACT|nr:hypothetical protein [Stieleria varia]TWU02413.1 hypothetical protein Pla52n_34630 [Stieleria varia]